MLRSVSLYAHRSACTGRTPFTKLSDALGQGRRVRDGWLFRCPAHDDHRPSLAVKERPDEVLLINCRAGCRTADILDAVGLAFQDLYPEDAYPWG